MRRCRFPLPKNGGHETAAMNISWASWLLWAFVATVFLTSILAASQSLGLTRMNIPFLLGTIFKANRDKAKFIGFFFHW
jgi:hypothetical protein